MHACDTLLKMELFADCRLKRGGESQRFEPLIVCYPRYS